jgi:branched-chain amino acid aminotransferase
MNSCEPRLDFSLHETDHVYVAQGTQTGEPGSGEAEWQQGQLVPFTSIPISPAAAVFSYGLGIFEGLKVCRARDGRLLAFRLQAHAERFQRSAEALLMPAFPTASFHRAAEQLVRSNLKYVPHYGQGSLYLRAVQFADQGLLGLAPCQQFRVVIYCSPVGPYFAPKGGGIRLRVVDRSRVAAGSTGWAKAISNYAGGLRLKTEWARQGYDDVLYLDALRFRYITETSGSNAFVRLGDGTVVTPRLDDQILPGITRDSAIGLLRQNGVPVEERQIEVAEVLSEAEEMFCTGTAWTVQAVASVDYGDRSRQFSKSDTRQGLFERLEQIKLGERPDPWGWTQEILL